MKTSHSASSSTSLTTTCFAKGNYFKTFDFLFVIVDFDLDKTTIDNVDNSVNGYWGFCYICRYNYFPLPISRLAKNLHL